MCHRFPLYHRLFSGDEWVASVAQMLTEPEYRAVVEDFGAGNHALEQEIPRRELPVNQRKRSSQRRAPSLFSIEFARKADRCPMRAKDDRPIQPAGAIARGLAVLVDRESESRRLDEAIRNERESDGHLDPPAWGKPHW